MRYRWNTLLSNRRLLRESDSTLITRTVRHRQLQLYGHGARYLEADLAHCVVLETIQSGEGQGNAFVVYSFSKSINLNPVTRYSGWEGNLDGESIGECLPGFGRTVEEATRLSDVCPH